MRKRVRAPRREATLRDGRTALVRRAKEDDAPGMLELERALIRVGVGVVRAMEELPADEEEMRRQMCRYERGTRSGEMGVQLVAILDGLLVGEGSAHRYPPARVRHNATITVGVLPDAQGLGVGRAIVEGLLAWCRATRTGEDPGVNRVRLDVFADNHRAIALYESFGFRVCGMRTRMIRNPDGSERNDQEMELLLDQFDTDALRAENAGPPTPATEQEER